MLYTFTGEVSAEYPEDTDTPRKIFFLTGIAVVYSTAPTTSENIELKLIIDDDTMDPLLVSRDPSANSDVNWYHLIENGAYCCASEYEGKS